MMPSDKNEPAPLSAAGPSGTSEDAGEAGIAVPGASGAATAAAGTLPPAVPPSIPPSGDAAFLPMDPMPLEDVARILAGFDLGAEPSRAVLVVLDRPGETARVLADRIRIERPPGSGFKVTMCMDGMPLAAIRLPDIDADRFARDLLAPGADPAWKESRGRLEVSLADMAAFEQWAQEIQAPRPVPDIDIAKLARALSLEVMGPMMPLPEGFEFGPDRCKGSTRCTACRTFRCARCKRRRPWCVGAHDEHPTWCDPCVWHRHNRCAKRCWRCKPAGSGDLGEGGPSLW